MSANTLFIVVHAHGSSKHEIVEQILADFDVVIAVVVIIHIIIIIGETGSNRNLVQSDLVLQEVLDAVAEEHSETCIEEGPFHGAGAVLVVRVWWRVSSIRICVSFRAGSLWKVVFIFPGGPSSSAVIP